jgi:phosphate transport system permease protein
LTSPWRTFAESFSGKSFKVLLICVNSLAFIIALVLLVKAWPILARKPLTDLLFSSSWHPLRGEFGFFPFIVGTIEVTLIAMMLSIPPCLLSAIYLSEYAHRRLREFVRFVVDILAAIPSVIYGLWGVLFVVPGVRYFGRLLGNNTTGYCLLSGGLILAIMVAPVIISVTLEVFRTVPMQARESTLALGTTKWELVKHVIVRSTIHGILAAIVLGFARAFGETIAVLMVIGNVPKIPSSLFDPAYPLPALIANNYGEMMSIPLYDSALMLAALILMVVVGIFSLTSHLVLLRIERRAR